MYVSCMTCICVHYMELKWEFDVFCNCLQWKFLLLIGKTKVWQINKQINLAEESLVNFIISLFTGIGKLTFGELYMCSINLPNLPNFSHSKLSSLQYSHSLYIYETSILHICVHCILLNLLMYVKFCSNVVETFLLALFSIHIFM